MEMSDVLQSHHTSRPKRWRRPCARSKMETKRLNSSCPKKDREDIIFESQKKSNHNKYRKDSSTSHRGPRSCFPCRTATWYVPISKAMKILVWRKLQKLLACDASRVNSWRGDAPCKMKRQESSLCNINGLVSSQEL